MEKQQNGYIALYKGQQKELRADNSYEAQQIATKLFNARKSWEITVVLAEKDGNQIIHTPDF